MFVGDVKQIFMRDFSALFFCTAAEHARRANVDVP